MKTRTQKMKINHNNKTRETKNKQTNKQNKTKQNKTKQNKTNQKQKQEKNKNKIIKKKTFSLSYTIALHLVLAGLIKARKMGHYVMVSLLCQSLLI